MRKAVLLPIAIFCLLRCQSAVGQPGVPQNKPVTNFNLESPLVIVPVLVTTRSGEPVFSLTKDDFALTDDGKPQAFTLEDDSADQPLALVVAIETGGAGAREFDKYSPLLRMLESTVGAAPHRIAVVSFDSQPSLALDFTPNVEAVVHTIAALTPGCSRQHHMENCEAPGSFHDQSSSDNGAAILDGLDFSIQLLRNQPAQYRRAILLISESIDRGSHLKVEDAVRELSQTDTIIYSIGFSTGKSEAEHYAYRELPGSHSYPNPPHGCMGKDPTPDPDATQNKAVQAYDCLTQLAPPLALAKMLAIMTADSLRRDVPRSIARLSGGEYFRLTDTKSLERSLIKITSQLPNRYVLSFRPQIGVPGFHAIAVRLTGYPNLEVTARTGYWLDAPPKPQDKAENAP